LNDLHDHDDTITHYATKSLYDFKLGSPDIYLHIWRVMICLKTAVQLCINEKVDGSIFLWSVDWDRQEAVVC